MNAKAHNKSKRLGHCVAYTYRPAHKVEYAVVRFELRTEPKINFPTLFPDDEDKEVIVLPHPLMLSRTVCEALMGLHEKIRHGRISFPETASSEAIENAARQPRSNRSTRKENKRVRVLGHDSRLLSGMSPELLDGEVAMKLVYEPDEFTGSVCRDLDKNFFGQEVLALFSQKASKRNVLKGIKRISSKIRAEGLFLGHFRHPNGDNFDMFDCPPADPKGPMLRAI